MAKIEINSEKFEEIKQEAKKLDPYLEDYQRACIFTVASRTEPYYKLMKEQIKSVQVLITGLDEISLEKLEHARQEAKMLDYHLAQYHRRVNVTHAARTDPFYIILDEQVKKVQTLLATLESQP